MLKLTWKEFLPRLKDAREMDATRTPRLKITDALVGHFAFDDTGAEFFHKGHEPKQPKKPQVEEDWSASWRLNPGYYEPETGWAVQ